MSKGSCTARGETVEWKCKRPKEPGSQYCFWHDPDRPKGKDDIQKKKAEFGEEGYKVQGAIVFGEGLAKADFSRLKLVEARFGEGKLTNLHKADFSKADLWRAKFRGSPDKPLNLSHANFNEANLHQTLFEDVNLDGADFKGAALISTTFKRSSLNGVLLGDAQRLENLELNEISWDKGKVNAHEQKEEWSKAQRVYATLKQAYNRQGDQKIAAEFFYREMECRRKGAKGIISRVGYSTLFFFWGYGEKPLRILGIIAAGIVFFAALYTTLDIVAGFPFYLYFSMVCFTLGYGSWGMTPEDPIRFLAILEAIFGVPMTGSFLVALARKMTR